jgi:hypothetical protein
MKWRAASEGQIYQCNEDSVVYFDPASGNTHLLSDFAGYLIEKLAGEAMDLEQIINQITPGIDSEYLPDIDKSIPQLLSELVALDVIEQE